MPWLADTKNKTFAKTSRFPLTVSFFNNKGNLHLKTISLCQNSAGENTVYLFSQKDYPDLKP